MNLKELKEIIEIVTSRESIEELEIEKSGVRLRIKRSANHHGAAISTVPSMPPVAAELPAPTTPAAISSRAR